LFILSLHCYLVFVALLNLPVVHCILLFRVHRLRYRFTDWCRYRSLPFYRIRFITCRWVDLVVVQSVSLYADCTLPLPSHGIYYRRACYARYCRLHSARATHALYATHTVLILRLPSPPRSLYIAVTLPFCRYVLRECSCARSPLRWNPVLRYGGCRYVTLRSAAFPIRVIYVAIGPVYVAIPHTVVRLRLRSTHCGVLHFARCRCRALRATPPPPFPHPTRTLLLLVWSDQLRVCCRSRIRISLLRVAACAFRFAHAAHTLRGFCGCCGSGWFAFLPLRLPTFARITWILLPFVAVPARS